MEQCKDIFLFLLLSGQEIPQKQLFHIMTILASLSDFHFGVEETLDEGTLFVEKACEVILRDYDEFIELYTAQLLKNENYELIKHLEL